MDKLDIYRNYISKILNEHSSKPTNLPDVDTQLIFDRDGDHYQLLYIGWKDDERIFSPSIHIDIIDGKIWIQKNDHDFLIEEDLVELGISKEDIVLGLQPPSYRKFTDYAVA